jgi:microcin C transport system substrate-binding protein
MYSAYTRSNSYFSNSELAATGLPSKEELAVLAPYKDQLPSELFTKPFTLPVTDGTGNNRDNLHKALALLKQAGYKIDNGKLIDLATGKPFTFEILLDDEAFIRIINPFIQNLKKLGIEATIRRIDDQQYIERLNKFDFDMIVDVFGSSLSPGNEQRSMWYSTQADIEGSGNLIGVKNKVVDSLVEAVINAPDREQLVTRTKALDRVLLWNYYVIPHWHYPYYRIAYWNKFARPAITPKYDLGFSTWWIDAAKAAKLAQSRVSATP